ncbi:hypothetical protein [Cellulomonas sp. KRMCY2]|uniref:hypothetical protein n=1 Tax=Cellulomonas sp. KRMCY2 TaxID=1304865 RepID=UPI0004B165D4|nr:hypothetical protein [Cellulomonas sp. KRMCY2]
MTLEVRVESAATGGLRIIDHIPAVRPCRLEGLNGIGKSAIVRLLVLISGVQPYPGEPAPWRSLRNLVGPTVITITGLLGDHAAARIELTPREWPIDPVENIGDWLGNVTLDGSTVPARRLFDVIKVVHLSGTERLADTLKQQVGRLAVALSDVAARLAALDHERAELGELVEQLDFASPNAAEVERAALEQAAVTRRGVREELSTVKPVVEDLSRAVALKALVETGDAAEHHRRLEELRAALETARHRLRAAEATHSAAVTALGKGSTAQREVAARERRLGSIKKTMDALLARQEEMGAFLDAHGIPSDVNALDARQLELLNEMREVARERQRQLRILAARQRRTEHENRVLDDLRVVLDDAISLGLDETVLARINDTDITVRQFRQGLGVLDGVKDDEAADLAGATRELAELTELADIFAQRAELQDEDEKLRSELTRLEPEAAGHDELRKAASAARVILDAASADVRSLNVQIGALSRSALGGLDVAEVAAVITELLEKHKLEDVHLSSTLSDFQSRMLDLEAKDVSLSEELERLSANSARRRVQREALRQRSVSDPSLKWLGELAGRLSERGSKQDGPEWSDATWQALAVHVSEFAGSLGRLVSDVSGLQAVASQTTASSTSRLGGAIRAVSEADAVAELSAGPIADALFDGGEVRRVSLEDETVTWTTPTGETRTRPLAAFSSGQQALGFMRARLQQVADQQSPNRLVFLDEFGAFISADRRRPLAELLTGDELGALGEQVVVVLPLQVDYARELDQTTGALHEEYERRARAVAERGYFTETFTG